MGNYDFSNLKLPPSDVAALEKLTQVTRGSGSWSTEERRSSDEYTGSVSQTSNSDVCANETSSHWVAAAVGIPVARYPPRRSVRALLGEGSADLLSMFRG